MRRLLIISTTFFPDPGVSAIRMTQWCRHLPQHGWKPYVLCRYYGFDATAEDLATHVHPEVSVTYLDKPEPQATEPTAVPMRQQLRQFARDFAVGEIGNLAVPDVSIHSWRRFRTQSLSHVQTIKPDVILTTSPPHSNHDIGAWLAMETGIPWMADFSDPYLTDDRFRPRGLGKLRWAAHERFTQLIYRRAWLITHAIPIQARWARLSYPFARDRIRILTNGFPLELLEDLAANDGPDKTAKRQSGARTLHPLTPSLSPSGGYLFTEGGAGDPPAPPGDPPGGMVMTPGCGNTALFLSMPPSLPSGGSPDGTGESPVLPSVNTYQRGEGSRVRGNRPCVGLIVGRF